MNIFGMFVKQPVPGTVKTRLAVDCGDERAAAIYTKFIESLVTRFRDVADRRVLSFFPNNETSRNYFEQLNPGSYELWPQPEGELGEKIFSFFETHLTNDLDRAVLIGSDSPTLPRESLERAFEELESNDVVIGPATDGGYYLIGMRFPARSIFTQIDWSGPQVLEQTVSRIRSQKLTLAVLPPWYDVDTLDGLQLLKGHLRALDLAEMESDLENLYSGLGWDTADETGFL